MKKVLLLALIAGLFLSVTDTKAQYGFGTSSPNSSAIIDMDVNNLGLLIPRIALTSNIDATTIPVGATQHSMIIYNTGTAGLTPAGYYYWNWTGSAGTWIKLSDGATNNGVLSQGTGITAFSFNSTANATVGIAPGGVSVTELATDAVTTIKILDGAVTTAKILGGSQYEVLTTNTTDGGTAWGLITNNNVNDVAWGKITGTPTTIAGYGITDAQPLDADLTSLAALAESGANQLIYSTTVDSWSAMAAPTTAGQLLTWNGTNIIWTAPATNGTVTSVGLELPSEFTVTNSPVTSSGTLTGAWATQNANLIFAGPTTGAAATPGFRSLVVADIPTGIPAANIGAGTVDNTEFGYLDGVTSSIKTQLDGKQATGNYITALTGDVTATGPGSVAATITDGAVTSAKILDGTILNEDIANLTITNAKLANSTIGLTSSGSITVGTSPISLGGTSALDLNMGNSNSWTAAQSFVNATISGTLNDGASVGTDGQVLKSTGTSIEWVDPSTLTVTETDPQVSSSTTNIVPKWTGTTLVDGIITDDGTSVSVAGTISATNLSGTNTGDQTITLTGPVTGTGNGTFATTITDGAVTSAKIADGTIVPADVDFTATGWLFDATDARITNLKGGATGSMPYQTAANTTGYLTAGTAGQYLAMNSTATAPEWKTFNDEAIQIVNGSSITITFGTNIFTSSAANGTNFSLPSPTGNAGKKVIVKRLSGNNFGIAVPTGVSLDGVLNGTLSLANYQSYLCQTDGTNWYVIGGR